MDNLTLGIAIPTYNRHQKIKEFLDHSIDALNKNGVQVFISDNHSTDTTEAVVKSYQKKYKNLHYYRQEKNKGIYGNFEFVLHWADTDYVWFCGDDDLIDTAKIPLVLDHMKNHPDMIVVNGGDAENRVWHVRSTIPDTLYTDKNLILRDLGDHMTWISCLIFSKEMLSELHMTDQSTAFPHAVAMFGYIAENPIHLQYISTPIVYTNNQDSPEGYTDKSLLYFCKQWSEMADRWAPYYSKEAIDGFKYSGRDTMPGRAWGLKSFMIFREQGYFDYGEYKKYRTTLSCLTSSNQHLIALISLMPVSAIKALHYIYHNLKKAFHK